MPTRPDPSHAPFGTYAPGPLLAAILLQTAEAGSGWLARRWMFLLRKIGAAILGDRPADVERLGCRMRLWPAGNTAEKRLLFTPQLFDPAERAILAQAAKPGFHFADVGANAGGYALAVAALAGRDSLILAVEPQPDILARLRCNLALSGFRQVVVSPHAVSDRDETVQLHINPDNKGESTIAGQAAGGVSVQVEARRLASLLRDAGFLRLDAMKLDVEGMEDRILADFLQPQHRALWPRLLIVEDAPSRWSADLPAQIERCGYREIAHTATNLVFERDAEVG